MTSISNPLDLLEIRLHIGLYLEKRDLVHCIRVSKAWYGTFLALVWKEVKVGYYYRHDATPEPPVSAHDLQRHRQWVCNLWIGTLPPGHYAFHYPKLHTLFLRQVEGYTHGQLERDPVQLIKLNSATLKTLELHGQNEYYLPTFWNTIGELPNLKSLSLDGSTIQKDRGIDFWKACINLETLQLTSTSISQVEDFTSLNLAFPRMRKLTLIYLGGLVGRHQLELIMRCPGLEELTWELGGWSISEGLRDEFTRLIIEKGWPKLERLSLSDGSEGIDDVDDVLANILYALPRVTKLDVHSTKFGALGFQSLRRHFATLSILNVMKCKHISSTMLLEILCSCPHLEEFSGEGFMTEDVAQSGAWSCLRLRKLHIYFSASSDQNLNEAVFERLSTLVRLEELSIGQDHGSKPLDFRLSNGMGALASLTRIRSFYIHGLTLRFGEKDLVWILAHWRMLDDFQGLPRGIEPNIRTRMVNLLRSHGLRSTFAFT